jgi:hypothetical protein
VHGDVGFVAVPQFQSGITDLGEFIGGQQPHSVNQSQIGHNLHSIFAVAARLLLGFACYNFPVLRKLFVTMASLGLAQLGFAQQPAQPQVKVNVLNVCAPSAEEQQQISGALAKIPKQPTFSPDFEVDRGRSTLDTSAGPLQISESASTGSSSETATWVRIRHEFPATNMFSTVQYSFSVDTRNMVETLVFRVRDPKDLLSIAIEDSASAVTTPSVMLAANTPASRIKLERMGKSSVVLARCADSEGSPAPDQSSYQPLFQSASKVLEDYRAVLDVRATVPSELARTGARRHKTALASKPPAKNSSAAAEPK